MQIGLIGALDGRKLMREHPDEYSRSDIAELGVEDLPYTMPYLLLFGDVVALGSRT